MGSFGLNEILNGLKYCGNSAFIIAAESCCSISTDNIALDYRMNVFAWLDLVGMSNKTDRIAGDSAGDMGYKVFAITALPASSVRNSMPR